MELSERLRAVAGLVTEGASVADIGTDHGYIPIYLMERGLASGAIASDINEGPLARARAHIGACGLSGRIRLRLSDGLRGIEAGEADTAIAAGMGGNLIVKILSESPDKVAALSALILQPQSDIDRVRRYLCGLGMRIEAEDMAKEDGKYYPVMRAVWSPDGEEPYEEWEYLYGRRLLEARHPVLREYLDREIRIYGNILAELERQKGSVRASERITEIRRSLSYAERALKCYDE